MDEWEIQEMIGALREQARVLAGEQLIARIPAREAELSQQIDNRNHQANINAAINVLWTAIESVVSYRIPEAAYYLSAAKAVTDTTEITMDDIAQALRDLHAIQSDHDWPRLHTRFPLSTDGVTAAIAAATQMTALKATVVPCLGCRE